MNAFQIIKEQRKQIEAPVDTMGCACIPATNNTETKKFRVLLMLLLSVQTRDQITYNTMQALNNALLIRFNEGITPHTVDLLSFDELLAIIRPVNFHIKKAKNIKAIAKNFLTKQLPIHHKELVCLPGVGNKIAFLYLQIACNKIVGIGVDSHVHRIFNRLGVVETKTAEETRIKLEKLYSKNDWQEINKVMVGFGQTICLPRNPKCDKCKAKYLCKYGRTLEF